MSDWISVDDRPPESNDDVIICTYVRDIYLGWWSHVTKHWIETGSGDVIKNVTHWQPLPGPPERKD